MISTKDTIYEVIVCGGGPSGVAAAISAARKGAKTLLIERYGFCGGMGTSALVNPWSGQEYTDPETNKPGSLIGGIFKEVALRLHLVGGFGSALTPAAFDEELLKYVYDVLLLEAGVHIRYHSYVHSIRMEGSNIASAHVISKGGFETFSAKNFIDCTGDADLAVMAGVPYEIGRPEDSLMQAMTVSFRMGNVDKKEMIATGNFRAARALVEPYFQEALAKEKLHYPYRNFIHFYDYPRPGILHFNMTRINQVSGLSADDLSKAEIEGRRQAFLISNWLIQSTPWFKDAYMEKIACQVGVRETRHIKGLYTVHSKDITESRKFPDGIVRSKYFIDIHNPKGAEDVQQIPGKKGVVKPDFGPPPGEYYEVPYRSLINSVCPNVIVACRALSATHKAAGAIRVMATMHGIGEAAGIAAAEAVKRQVDVAFIPGEWVRKQIPYLSEEPDFGMPWNVE